MFLCLTKECVEFEVAFLRALDGDTALFCLSSAEWAETRDTRSCPTAAYHIVERPHAFAAPCNSVDVVRVTGKHRFDLANQVCPIIRMVEAGTVRAPTVNVDLGDLGEPGDEAHHSSGCVVVIEGEEAHSARLHPRCDGRDHVEVVVIRRTKFLDDGIAEVFWIVVVVCASGGGRFVSPKRPVIWERNITGDDVGGVREIREGENGVDVAYLLQIIKQLVDAFVEPCVCLDLDADHVLAIDRLVNKRIGRDVCGARF
jgi:hypothetical protein